VPIAANDTIYEKKVKTVMVNHTILIVSRKWTSYHKALNIKKNMTWCWKSRSLLWTDTKIWRGYPVNGNPTLPPTLDSSICWAVLDTTLCDEVCLWLVAGLMWWSLSVTCGRSDVMKFVCDLWQVRCFLWFLHHQYNWPTQHYINGNILHKNSEETDS
jgi:hypothetical protein